MNFCTTLKFLLRNITVEPAFVLFWLAHGFYTIASKDLYIAKVCRVNLNYTGEVCDNIQQHEQEQIKVQKYTSELEAYNRMLQSLPGILYVLFAGPWSDFNGRKALLTFPVFGYVINNGVYIINTYFFYELKAEFLLFECLQDFTGGTSLFYLGIYSYLSDVSSPETRTIRFAFIDGIWPIAYYSSTFLAAYIKTHFGHMPNYVLGIVFRFVKHAWY